MSFVSEIGQLLRFRRLSNEKKEIVFYAEHAGYYPNFEGLIDELTIKHNRTICYITSDQNDPILNTDNTNIIPFYLSKLLSLFFGFMKSGIMIMTMTDLNRFFIKRSINPVHYVYVFHSLVSTHMLYLEGAFDHYDSILCTGKYQVDEIRKHESLHNLPAKKLMEAGYYRLERIYSSYKIYSEQHKDNPPNKKTILVAPSWGDDNIIESCGPELTEILLSHGYRVIVRPHPETIKRNPAVIDNLESRFGDNKKFRMEKSVATDDSLLEADLLISDLSGIVLEYAFGTERPVLFIDVPPKVRNKNYAELGIEPIELTLRPKLGNVVAPDSLESIPEIINNLISESGKYKRQMTELRDRYISNFGRFSAAGAEYILSLIEK